MTSKILLVLMLAMFTAACFHKPQPHGCPPGQAKKGNCIVIDRD